MKTIKLILAITVFTFTLMVNASTNPTKKNDNAPQVIEEIFELLKDPYFKVNYDLQARVKFIVNVNNEIVVLTVETTSVELRSFIKDRMNQFSRNMVMPMIKLAISNP